MGVKGSEGPAWAIAQSQQVQGIRNSFNCGLSLGISQDFVDAITASCALSRQKHDAPLAEAK